jgi:hypothetical protein
VNFALDVVDAQLALHILARRVQRAAEFAGPVTEKARRFRQALGTDHDQCNRDDQKEFGKTDIGQGRAPGRE